MALRGYLSDELLLDNLMTFVAGEGSPILKHPITTELRASVLERMSERNESAIMPANAGQSESARTTVVFAHQH